MNAREICESASAGLLVVLAIAGVHAMSGCGACTNEIGQSVGVCVFDGDGMPLVPDRATFSVDGGMVQECSPGGPPQEHCVACGLGLEGMFEIEVTVGDMTRTASTTVTKNSCQQPKTQQVDVFFP